MTTNSSENHLKELEQETVNKVSRNGNLRKLDISPPHDASETASLLPEAKSVPLHVCGFIHQQLQTLPSIQDFIDILNHHVPNLKTKTNASRKIIKMPKKDYIVPSQDKQMKQIKNYLMSYQLL